MHEILMQPFEKVIKEAKPWGAMSSYNTYDGVPVTGSSYFLTDLLRGEYGFNGYVVSDSGAVDRLKSQHKNSQRLEDRDRRRSHRWLERAYEFSGDEKVCTSAT